MVVYRYGYAQGIPVTVANLQQIPMPPIVAVGIHPHRLKLAQATGIDGHQ